MAAETGGSGRQGTVPGDRGRFCVSSPEGRRHRTVPCLPLTAGCIERIGENEAEGLWLDLGWTILGPMFGNTKDRVPVLPNIGRYRMKLRRYGDIWKVYDLNWGPLIQYGMWSFEKNNTDGWSGTDTRKQWPGLEETCTL